MYKLGFGVLCLGVVFFNGCSGDDDDASSRGGAAGQASGGKASGGASNGGKVGSGGSIGNGGSPSGGTSPNGGSAFAGGGSAGEGGASGGSAGHEPTGGIGGDGFGGEGGALPGCADPGPFGGEGGAASIEGCDGSQVWTGTAMVTSDQELEALRGYSVIQGDLTLDQDVSSLEALRCLTRVTGDLTVRASSALRDLKGLDNLKRVDGSLEFLYRYRNDEGMKNLTGLEGLTRVGALVIGELSFTPRSETCCFEYNSPPLTTLAPLRHLRQAGRVFIARTGVRNLDGLQCLTELESLVLVDMDSLESLDGLASLARVYGSGTARTTGFAPGEPSSSAGVLVRQNPRLRHVNALSTLRELSSTAIMRNERLNDIRGLANVQGTESFTVTDNHALDTCQVNNVVAQIESRGDIGTTTISGNAACTAP